MGNIDPEESEMSIRMSSMDFRINAVQEKMSEEISRGTKEAARVEVAAQMLDAESHFVAIRMKVQEELKAANKEMIECMHELEGKHQRRRPLAASTSFTPVKSHQEITSLAPLSMARLSAENAKSSLEDTLEVSSADNVGIQELHANDMFSTCKAVHLSAAEMSDQPRGSNSGQAFFEECTLMLDHPTEMAIVTSEVGCETRDQFHVDDFSGQSRVSILNVCSENDTLSQTGFSDLTTLSRTPLGELPLTTMRAGGVSLLVDPPPSRMRTAETPRRTRAGTVTAPKSPISKDSWSPSAEPQRRVGVQRWDNGGPDKRTFGTFGSLLSPRKERKEEIATFTKSPRKERKKEIISQCASEDSGSSKTGPSPTGGPSLRSLVQAKSQKEDITPPRKMPGVLTPPREDGRHGRSPLEYREDQPTFLKVSSSPPGNFGKHQHQMGGQTYAKTDSSLVVGPRER